jgi:hypothetical protein
VAARAGWQLAGCVSSALILAEAWTGLDGLRFPFGKIDYFIKFYLCFGTKIEIIFN